MKCQKEKALLCNRKEKDVTTTRCVVRTWQLRHFINLLWR